jgi:WD40 repeat protein
LKVIEVKYNPYNTDEIHILSGHVDGKIMLWDAQGNLVKRLDKHEFAIRDLTQIEDPDAQNPVCRILSSDIKKVVYIWNLQDDSKITLDIKHDIGKPILIRKNEHHHQILASSSDNILRVWEKDGTFVEGLEGHTDVILGVIQLSNGQIVSWGMDRTIRIWSLDKQNYSQTQGFIGIKGVNLHKLIDDNLVSVPQYTDNQQEASGHIHIWDSEGTLIAQLRDENLHAEHFFELSNTNLMTYGRDFKFRLWSNRGKLLKTLPFEPSLMMQLKQLKNGNLISWVYSQGLCLWDTDLNFIKDTKPEKIKVDHVLLLSNGHFLTWNQTDLHLWDEELNLLVKLDDINVKSATELSTDRILFSHTNATLSIRNYKGEILQSLEDSPGFPASSIQILSDSRIVMYHMLFELSLHDAQGKLIDTLRMENPLERVGIYLWAKKHQIDIPEIYREPILHTTANDYEIHRHDNSIELYKKHSITPEYTFYLEYHLRGNIISFPNGVFAIGNKTGNPIFFALREFALLE